MMRTLSVAAGEGVGKVLYFLDHVLLASTRVKSDSIENRSASPLPGTLQ